jgi:lycopene beta-cyclase
MTTATWLVGRARAARIERGPLALLAAWALSMVMLPVARWAAGEDAVPAGVAATTLLQAAAVLVFMARTRGWRPVARTAALVVAAAWLLELAGSHTGLPFGDYSYTERLQPQFGGVPLLIPLAWLMMLPPAWAVAAAITGRSRGAVFVLVSALAFTAWDLFLDPQMVAWGFWTWAEPWGYFGVPWVNFAGWLAAAALLTLLARPAALPLRPLLAIYAITWALQTIGQVFFWALPGPALAGGAAMGVLLAAAFRAARERPA